MKVLVTGATGNVGGEVIKSLLAKEATVKALARKTPEESKFPKEVEISIGDLTNPVSLEQALQGTDKLFLLIANVADEFTQAITAVGLARKAGIKHIVYLSVFRAADFPEVPHFAAKFAVETAIRNSGIAFTILRPGYFIQNDARIKALLTGPGVYPMPVGPDGIAVVDVRDIGEAAATALTSEEYVGRTIDLVSAEKLSGPGAAALWSQLLGKPVRYAGHSDFNAYEAQLRNNNVPAWLAYDLRIMFQAYVEQGFASTEFQVATLGKLLGHEPRTYTAFAKELLQA